MKESIQRHYDSFCYGVFSLLTGGYLLLHLNYLEDPKVTPPPPPSALEHSAFQFADDWWFAALLLAAGLVLVIGVLGGSKKLRTCGLAALAPLYGMLILAFCARSFGDGRFNLTWLFVGLALALLIGTARRGGYFGR